ncbi:MAG: diaminopimelate epimerase, partial [Planctomycetota bacterium]
MKLVLMAGAGNTFAVIDARAQPLPDDLPELARRLCAEAWEGKPATLDGLLVVQGGDEASACRMVIYNADGSRPEACGNGLRCVAKFAR